MYIDHNTQPKTENDTYQKKEVWMWRITNDRGWNKVGQQDPNRIGYNKHH